MKKFILLFVALLFTGSAYSQAIVTDRLQRKMQAINPIEYTRVLIIMKDQVDIESLDASLYRMNATIEYRAQTVINTLRQKALLTQGGVLDMLRTARDQGKVREYMDFWITNVIYAEATSDVLVDLAKRNDIEVMDLDEKIFMDLPVYVNENQVGNATETAETGLKVIKADLLWRLGITGAGRTVMNIDTGVDALHPALGSRWWGNNGRPWYHSWYDPVAPFTTSPTDCGSHGTHTMGIMSGRNTASGDTVGVAPDARWMAAGITDCPGASYPSMNIAAYQWAMDPDSNSATMDMPDVISCSWQDPNVPGVGQCTSIYVSTLNAVEAAGIAVVFSAGNSGPGVSTVTPPKNINTDSVNVFSVGAVDGNTSGTPIASFSSRGPSICGGSGTLLIKPEVSAPGVNVRSTIPNNGYTTMSGTSMAAPHTAGAIALLKQVAPGLTGKQIKAILFSTCTDLGDAGEDNTYGKGLINVYAAFQQLGVFPLNPFNLTAPSAGARIVSFPNSSATVTFNWDTSATGANYKWIFGSPTTSPRKLTVPAFSNSLTLTLGQLDNMLAGIGLNPGDSLVGQWDVWGFRISPVDSMKATNGPRAITLRRGVPTLSAFNLLNPPNNTTIVTSVFNTSNVNINWTSSGPGVTYKWKFGNPAISNVRLTLPSNGSGYDTALTIANSSLDLTLAGLGLNPGDSLAGQWAVWSYTGNDSLKSTQTFNLTLKRQAKGDVVIVYDSTVAAGRTSRDSVANNLSALGVTFDLFNRKTNTTGTSSISFRGYKKVILLGEGTSIASNVIKDSIKSYLNAGTAGVKSKLIIMGEDVTYHFDRAASTYVDTAFARGVLGVQFVLDRPASGANQGLTGVVTNPGARDSTIGPWPEVMSRPAGVPSNQSHVLYEFTQGPGTYNGLGRITPTYNVAVFGVDVESLRPSANSPAGSPVRRFVKGGLDFVDGMLTSNGPVNTSLVPQVYSLSQNYPNPFNPTTRISFSIPKAGLVTMKIYDILGKEVMTLVNEQKAPGVYDVEFNGASLASGAYFYRINAGDFTAIRRMVLIK